jgi:hypothetical protein
VAEILERTTFADLVERSGRAGGPRASGRPAGGPAGDGPAREEGR